MEINYYSVRMLSDEWAITKQGASDKIKAINKRLTKSGKKPLPIKKMLVDNRETTFYGFTKEQIDSARPKTLHFTNNGQATNQVFGQAINNQEPTIESQLVQSQDNRDKSLEQVLSNESVLDFMREYADLRSKADQVLLLTDKTKELAGDKQYWQDKFFEVDNNNKLKDKWLIACLFIALIFGGLFIYQLIKPPVIKEVTKVVYQPSKPLVQAKTLVKPIKKPIKRRR